MTRFGPAQTGSMDARTRLETAWSFREPDRVPVEMALADFARGLPGADRIAAFVEREADNFAGVPLFDWGFLGLDCRWLPDEVIEEVPGKHRRIRHRVETSAGEFFAITRHFPDVRDPADYHWERRYLHSLSDFTRLADADFRPRPFDLAGYNAACAKVGGRGLPATLLFHSLGALVRNSTLEEVYAWLVQEKAVTKRFLEKTCRQTFESILSLRGAALTARPVFLSAALEMLIPPWLGRRQFEEFVFPYDRQVNDAIHAVGGRHRAHCHGNSGQFLERFADMGVDAVEPLEPPPFGDNLLKEAKARAGGRMLLSGNLPSQAFYTLGREEVREMTRRAIDDAAAGGGFTLRLSGGSVGLGATAEQAALQIDRALVFIETALEFGRY